MTKIAVFVGSLSEGSINKKLAKAIEDIAPEGVEIVYPSIDLELFNYENETPRTPEVAELKETVESADGILFVTPEYNRSIPGPLKNAIDWASRPYGDNSFVGKPAAMMGASSGALGTSQAQQQLRNVLLYLGMDVMGQPEAYIDFPNTFDEDGNPKESTKEFLKMFFNAYLDHVAHVNK